MCFVITVTQCNLCWSVNAQKSPKTITQGGGLDKFQKDYSNKTLRGFFFGFDEKTCLVLI